MLFDLRGKRQNAIKATYLLLALLMGGGLVFFGIGGEVSGGLLNAFGGGGTDADSAIQDRIDRNEERLSENPRAQAALKELVRDNYQLATAQIPSGASGFPPEARDDLAQAAAYWQRYLKLEPEKPDGSLASLAAQLYGIEGLNQPAEAQEAYRIIAEQVNDSGSYLQLVAAALQADDQRTAELAAVKAIDLAPKGEREAVEKQIEQLKKDAKAQAGGAQAGG